MSVSINFHGNDETNKPKFKSEIRQSSGAYWITIQAENVNTVTLFFDQEQKEKMEKVSEMFNEAFVIKTE